MKIKNICCIGAGYVGGPTMAVIALKCPDIKVTVVDLDKDKIDAWNGELDKLPVFEPGLKEVVEKVRNKNLFFSTEIDQSIDESEMIFMAVNTPTKTEGEGAGMAADLKYFIASAKQIAKASNSNKIVVEKSTLPVRTAEKIKEILEKEGKNAVKFEILSNPEFLAEGTAIQDLFKSDRVLVGGDKTNSGKIAVQSLVDIYANWIPRNKILKTNVWTSELAKLASNAMLAQRISSINSLSALSDKTGADIDELSKAIGMDTRIGEKFLKVSVGFGGSCFKKDILNLVYLCRYYNLDIVADFWESVVKINDFQKNRFSEKILIKANEINEQHITILGWAFKKNTNDSRESASIDIAFNLLLQNKKVFIFDPMIKKERVIKDLFERFNPERSGKFNQLCKNVFVDNTIEEAIKRSRITCILTEWDEFIKYNWTKFLNDDNFIFDGRNILNLDNPNYYKL